MTTKEKLREIESDQGELLKGVVGDLQRWDATIDSQQVDAIIWSLSQDEELVCKFNNLVKLGRRYQQIEMGAEQ